MIREGDTDLVRRRLREFSARTGRPHFAETFIEGREFNLPMLDGPDGPQILPVGEMDFSTFPATSRGSLAIGRNSTKAPLNTITRRGISIPSEHDRPLVELITPGPGMLAVIQPAGLRAG